MVSGICKPRRFYETKTQDEGQGTKLARNPGAKLLGEDAPGNVPHIKMKPLEMQIHLAQCLRRNLRKGGQYPETSV